MSKQEKLVIIFLLLCATVGLGISIYKKTHRPQINIVPSDIKKESASLETRILSNRIININTSNEEELTSLPGIGPALAKKIIAYREENGPFTFAEDITKVTGIGKAKYESIKNFITTEDEAPSAYTHKRNPPKLNYDEVSAMVKEDETPLAHHRK